MRIGGYDIRDVTQESLHDVVGVVTQDAHLFHDTIRANLTYARPDGLFVRPVLDWVPQGAWADYANTLHANSYVTVGLEAGFAPRPWLFLFIASACWLANDVLAILPLEMRRDPDMVIRPLAILFGGAAAIAQLFVKRDVGASLAD